jgi:hypothetical protein
MSASKGWTCDGIPKDGKDYSGLGGSHEPHVNYTTDCDLCSLPYESSIKKPGGIPKPAIIAAIAAGVILLIGGGTAYTFVFKGCSQGMQKIDGQCIDPYRQAYDESVANGDKALNMVKTSPKNLQTLTTAQGILTNAITQLTGIPADALVYAEVQQKLPIYDREKAKIQTIIDLENKAEQHLNEAKTIATAAKEQSDKNTTSELTQAKAKWQQAISKLKAIEKGTLVASQVPQYQSQYEQAMAGVEAKIASLNTPVYTPPVVRPYTPPPTVVRRTPTYTPAPQPQPSEPSQECAVEPKPDYCIF